MCLDSRPLLRGVRNDESGVAGFARQHAGIDAELAQRLFVFGVGVGTEDQFGVGGAMQPAVLLNFLFQLTCAQPA